MDITLSRCSAAAGRDAAIGLHRDAPGPERDVHGRGVRDEGRVFRDLVGGP
ncbi:hypothetical protein [Streptomyces minutiscleroticus]|uniref:hypothetical protein n=1 Tax=Streptomyces minutiscleroticus TaxID=68238 RepID=UPI00167D4B06|nr:hypothetical protein [Streptomyces minutiscleroticus]